MKKAILILCLVSGPAIAQTSITDTRSADIMAEIQFLTDLLPPPQVLRGDDRKAFEDFLASKGGCDGLSFSEYRTYVEGVAVLFGDNVQMRLGEGAYDTKRAEGCMLDVGAQQVVETYLGNMENRSLILDGLSIRRTEMLRRTLKSE